MPRDAVITQGMRQSASLQPGTACHSAARHGGSTPQLPPPPPPPLPAPTAGYPRPTAASGGASGAAAASVQHRGPCRAPAARPPLGAGAALQPVAVPRGLSLRPQAPAPAPRAAAPAPGLGLRPLLDGDRAAPRSQREHLRGEPGVHEQGPGRGRRAVSTQAVARGGGAGAARAAAPRPSAAPRAGGGPGPPPAAVAGGTGRLPPHLRLGGPGPRVLAPLGAAHHLRERPRQLLLAPRHGLPARTTHPHQAAGLALLEPAAPRAPQLHLAAHPLPRGGRLQVLLPLRGLRGTRMYLPVPALAAKRPEEANVRLDSPSELAKIPQTEINFQEGSGDGCGRCSVSPKPLDGGVADSPLTHQCHEALSTSGGPCAAFISSKGRGMEKLWH